MFYVSVRAFGFCQFFGRLLKRGSRESQHIFCVLNLVCGLEPTLEEFLLCYLFCCERLSRRSQDSILCVHVYVIFVNVVFVVCCNKLVSKYLRAAFAKSNRFVFFDSFRAYVA